MIFAPTFIVVIILNNWIFHLHIRSEVFLKLNPFKSLNLPQADMNYFGINCSPFKVLLPPGM